MSCLLSFNITVHSSQEEGHARPTYPVMCIDGEDSSAMIVVLENHLFEVTDIVGGTALVLALYWVHDNNYRQKASRSLALIGHFIGLKYKIKSVLALDLITKLEAC